MAVRFGGHVCLNPPLTMTFDRLTLKLVQCSILVFSGIDIPLLCRSLYSLIVITKSNFFLLLGTKYRYSYVLTYFIFQKETPSDQQLHLAALQGNVEQIRKVLEGGKVHVDCKDKVCCRFYLDGFLKFCF